MNNDIPMIKSVEQIQQEAIDKQVARVFEDAAQFDSAYLVIQRWAHRHGWAVARDRRWNTKQLKGGPAYSFDTFGE